jgi:CRP-like cAMP-binding protein
MTSLNSYFVLESGVVRSFVYDIDSNDITINFFTESDIVIEASSLFQRIPSIENIQAETDCSVWKISYDDFQELFHSIPALTEWEERGCLTSYFISKTVL